MGEKETSMPEKAAAIDSVELLHTLYGQRQNPERNHEPTIDLS
jgi:hypothetical protein